MQIKNFVDSFSWKYRAFGRPLETLVEDVQFRVRVGANDVQIPVLLPSGIVCAGHVQHVQIWSVKARWMDPYDRDILSRGGENAGLNDSVHRHSLCVRMHKRREVIQRGRPVRTDPHFACRGSSDELGDDLLATLGAHPL